MVKAKHLTYIALITSGFILLGSGVWLYYRHQVWLQRQSLDSLLLVGLIILGIFVVLMPFHLRVHWETLTSRGMVREFAVKAGQIMGLLATIVAVFYLVMQLITLPIKLGYPDLMWLWLFLLLIPLLMVLIDLFNQTYARTWTNLGVGFLLYIFKLNGMILIQIVVAGGALLLFPAGFLMQFLSLVDIIMTQIGRGTGDLLLLCDWANVEATNCTPFLFTFHIGHLLLVGVVALYGEVVFNKTADLYANVLEWLAARLVK
jgi:hypothetical protein